MGSYRRCEAESEKGFSNAALGVRTTRVEELMFQFFGFEIRCLL